VRDPGRDGDLSLGGNTHSKVATDAFGYTLGYFAGDYNPIGTFTTASKFEASTTGSDLLAARSDLWNGNISHMVTCLPKATDYAANQTITPEAFGSAYKYDQLNRLSSSRVFTNINTTTNQWQSGAGTNPSAYATDYTYDAMGNILSQKRNGGGTSATALDELTYNYHTTTDGLVSNRLYQVNDVVSAGNYSDDIDDQGTFNNTHSTIETANNYGYDELGNLVRDVQEEIASIEWTVYGKMKKITRNSGSSKADLEFGYDASGNRLWKKVTPKGSGAVISTYYYLRDAQGNEMCRYVKYTNTTSQLMYVAQEHSIYGSSRVGVDNRKDTLYKAGSYSPAWGGANTSRRALGLKSFELSNHLGNVLVTVSDKPVYKVSSTTIFFQPEVTSISDYYPFGATIAGRSFSSTEYRFGFNNQEKDDEISGPGNHNTATFWEYDSRLGRRWNQDPVTKPWESLYATNYNNSIVFTDPLGLFGSRQEAREYRREHRNDLKLQGAKIKKGEDGIYSINDKNGGWSYSRDDLKADRPDLIGVQDDGVLRTMLISADKSNRPSAGAYNDGAEEIGKRGGKFKVSTDPLISTDKIKYYDNAWGGNQYIKTKNIFNERLTKGIAKHSPIIGHILDAKEVIEGIQADGNALGVNTAIEVTGLVGGAVGAWAGASGGAAIGSLIFPGFGTVIGGAVGAILGSWGGEETAEVVTRKAVGE
jgi:YD repeat-containing protein